MATFDTARLLGLANFSQLLSEGLRLVATADGGLMLVASGPSVTVTVNSPPDYAGAYAIPTAVAETAPIPLLSPVVEGAASPGATLSARSALWVFGSQLSESRSWRWQRDGVDIPGAGFRDYTVAPADAGTTLAVVESFDYGTGSIEIASAGVAA